VADIAPIVQEKGNHGMAIATDIGNCIYKIQFNLNRSHSYMKIFFILLLLVEPDASTPFLPETAPLDGIIALPIADIAIDANYGNIIIGIKLHFLTRCVAILL